MAFVFRLPVVFGNVMVLEFAEFNTVSEIAQVAAGSETVASVLVSGIELIVAEMLVKVVPASTIGLLLLKVILPVAVVVKLLFTTVEIG